MCIARELAQIGGSTCTYISGDNMHKVAQLTDLLDYRLDCQSDLSASISKLNPKSKLHVIREAPQMLLPKIFKAWKVSHLVFEKDTDAYARERDAEVIKLAKEAGVEVIVRMGRTLHDPDELVKNNGGRPTMSITQVEHVGLTFSYASIQN